jgi:hypothetical protein
MLRVELPVDSLEQSIVDNVVGCQSKDKECTEYAVVTAFMYWWSKTVYTVEATLPCPACTTAAQGLHEACGGRLCP